MLVFNSATHLMKLWLTYFKNEATLTGKTGILCLKITNVLRKIIKINFQLKAACRIILHHDNKYENKKSRDLQLIGMKFRLNSITTMITYYRYVCLNQFFQS